MKSENPLQNIKKPRMTAPTTMPWVNVASSDPPRKALSQKGRCEGRWNVGLADAIYPILRFQPHRCLRVTGRQLAGNEEFGRLNQRSAIAGWESGVHRLITAIITSKASSRRREVLRMIGQRDAHALPFVLTLGLVFLGFSGLGISIWPNIIPPGISLWQAGTGSR
jgi:hypothetical protein